MAAMQVSKGDILLDRNGEYEVLSVSVDARGVLPIHIVYQYLGGYSAFQGDLETKVRIHENIMAEKARKKKSAERNYKYADDPALQPFLEFLIDHGRIGAAMPGKDFAEFRRKYYSVTGQWTDEDSVAVKIDDTKRALALTVSFPYRGADLLLADVFHVYSKENCLEISKNALVWELLDVGFRLGVEHRKARR